MEVTHFLGQTEFLICQNKCNDFLFLDHIHFGTNVWGTMPHKCYIHKATRILTVTELLQPHVPSTALFCYIYIINSLFTWLFREGGSYNYTAYMKGIPFKIVYTSL